LKRNIELMKKEVLDKICAKYGIEFYASDFVNHCLNCKKFEKELPKLIQKKVKEKITRIR